MAKMSKRFLSEWDRQIKIKLLLLLLAAILLGQAMHLEVGLAFLLLLSLVRLVASAWNAFRAHWSVKVQPYLMISVLIYTTIIYFLVILSDFTRKDIPTKQAAIYLGLTVFVVVALILDSRGRENASSQNKFLML